MFSTSRTFVLIEGTWALFAILGVLREIIGFLFGEWSTPGTAISIMLLYKIIQTEIYFFDSSLQVFFLIFINV